MKTKLYINLLEKEVRRLRKKYRDVKALLASLKEELTEAKLTPLEREIRDSMSKMTVGMMQEFYYPRSISFTTDNPQAEASAASSQSNPDPTDKNRL